MSLLMQALQKAAKERESAAQPQTGTSALPGDLTLEPLGTTLLSEPEAVRSAGPGGSERPTPDQAASVMRATHAGPSVGQWVLDHRPAVYGGLIATAILGYGAYFYVSVYHPSLLRRTPAPALVATNPVPATPEPTSTPSPAVTPGEESGQSGAPGSNSVPYLPPTRGSATSRRSPASQGEISEGIERPQGAAGSRVPAPPAPPAAESASRRARDSIAVQRGGEPPRVNPRLVEAYDAMRSGRTEDARRLYDTLLATEPGNVDALLGRGTVAQQQGDPDLASRYFLQVIQVEPANTIAQGALVNLLGRADPQAAESRLKSLIGKEPSAFLYFSLGNLYADQGNWPSAQTAYFQAHHYQPEIADYAFNLAVSLEHLSQPKLAIGFYRQALDLARQSGRANFDSAAAEERVRKLSAAVD
jgi:tetratricopeptide (TPR) repeat protein